MARGAKRPPLLLEVIPGCSLRWRLAFLPWRPHPPTAADEAVPVSQRPPALEALTAAAHRR